MRFFSLLMGALLGSIVGVALLTTVASNFQNLGQTAEVSAPTVAPQEIVRQLAIDKDTAGAEAFLKDAHQKSLSGQLSYDEIRALFKVFESTAPEIKEFTESWLDEMPDSPYALTALAWNLYTAGFNMRGERLSQFTFVEGMIRFGNLHERANRLARLAFSAAPDLVPASDAVLRLMITNGSNQLEPPKGVEFQSQILSKVMQVTPNRGSLIRALSITQPQWRGDYEGAEQMCTQFAHLVTDVPEYTAEICLVDAAYTYDYGDSIRALARETLKNTDLKFLDYARRKDWEPGVSEAMDREIREYLERVGGTDIDLARSYDWRVSKPKGLPMIGEAIFAAYLEDARSKLQTDPHNPELIRALTEPPMGSYPGDNKTTGTDDVLLAKRALDVAPFDADVWQNIAMISHVSSDPADGTENAFFVNSMVFSNYSPSYFFEYLSAKQIDYAEIGNGIGTTEVTENRLATIDEAVVCPLIRLIRMTELMCPAVQNNDPSFYGSACDADTGLEKLLAELTTQAKSRQACGAEIDAETIGLFTLEPVQTDFELPAPLLQQQ